MELPDGDITPLLEHVDTAVFINISPGVDAQRGAAAERPHPPPRQPRPHGAARHLDPGRDRHPAHGRARASPGSSPTAGCPVPEEWYVADESPKRGLVLKTYDAPPEQTLRWLVEACRRLCPLEVHLPWQAVVRTR